MRRPLLPVLAIVAGAGLLVFALGAMVAFFVSGSGGSESDPSFVRVDPAELDGGVYCDDDRFFCITAESAEQGFALATVNERSFTVLARHGGCPARWLPDFDLSSVNGGPGSGAFRVPCDGQTFSRVGTTLFGPAPSDMLRLPLRLDDGEYMVDIRPLRTVVPRA